VKLAVTVWSLVTVTVHEPTPLHAPLQPPNVEPESGEVLSVMTVPEVTVAEHVAPQLMPPALPVTVPLPVPDFVTVSVYVRAVVVTDSTTCGAAL
jgi:hypothetical protein